MISSYGLPFTIISSNRQTLLSPPWAYQGLTKGLIGPVKRKFCIRVIRSGRPGCEFEKKNSIFVLRPGPAGPVPWQKKAPSREIKYKIALNTARAAQNLPKTMWESKKKTIFFICSLILYKTSYKPSFWSYGTWFWWFRSIEYGFAILLVQISWIYLNGNDVWCQNTVYDQFFLYQASFWPCHSIENGIWILLIKFSWIYLF